MLKHPLQHLYPLEIPHPSTQESVEGTNCKPEPETQTNEGKFETVERNGRPLRSAAKKARDNARAIDEQESDQD